MANRPQGSGSIRAAQKNRKDRKDRKNVWQLRWQEAGRSRTKTVHGKISEAEAVLRALVNESALVQKGSLLAENPNMTTAEWLDDWLKNIVEPGLAATTAMKYRSIVKRDLVPVIGSIPVRKLSPADVRRVTAPLAGRAWQKEVHTVLSSALSAAENDDVIVRNPAKKATVKTPERAEKVILTPDQTVTLVKAVRGTSLEAYWLLSILTGARGGELRGAALGECEPRHRRAKYRARPDSRHGEVGDRSAQDGPLAPDARAAGAGAQGARAARVGAAVGEAEGGAGVVGEEAEVGRR